LSSAQSTAGIKRGANHETSHFLQSPEVVNEDVAPQIHVSKQREAPVCMSATGGGRGTKAGTRAHSYSFLPRPACAVPPPSQTNPQTSGLSLTSSLEHKQYTYTYNARVRRSSYALPLPQQHMPIPCYFPCPSVPSWRSRQLQPPIYCTHLTPLGPRQLTRRPAASLDRNSTNQFLVGQLTATQNRRCYRLARRGADHWDSASREAMRPPAFLHRGRAGWRKKKA
jgi:hypothetical protein